jgi:hypothetical protein
MGSPTIMVMGFFFDFKKGSPVGFGELPGEPTHISMLRHDSA